MKGKYGLTIRPEEGSMGTCGRNDMRRALRSLKPAHKRNGCNMEESKVREVFSNLNTATHTECQQADAWVKAYAIEKLTAYLGQWRIPPALKAYTLTCVRAHYGSVETDELLQKCKCYPEWLAAAIDNWENWKS